MWSLIAKLFRLIDIIGARPRAIGVVVLTVIGAALEALGVGVILPALKLLLESGDALQPYIPEALQGWIASHNIVPIAAFAILTIFLVKNAYLALLLAYQTRFVWSSYAAISANVLRYYMGRDYQFHLENNSSALITNIHIAMRQIFVTSLQSLVMMVSEALVIVAILVTLLILEPLPTIVVAGLLAGIGMGYYALVHRRVSAWGRRTMAHFQQALLWLNHALGAVKEISVLGRAEYFVDKFQDHNRASARYSRLIAVTNQMPRYILETAAMTLFMIAVMASHWFGIALQSHLPTVGVFIVAALRLMPSISRIVMYISNLRYGEGSLERMFDEVGAAMRMEEVPPANAGREPIRLRQAIVFDGVSFAYQGDRDVVLRDVTLTIRKGETIALVGASGAGKTTLADLLLGLLRPTKGRVSVDGRPIDEDIESWRSRIGYIPQSVFLIDDTIRRNIALGVRDEQIDNERLRIALRKSHLDETVAGLTSGIDTVVGENGVRLSGGQRQRIGIARALYGDSDLLIMDEPTSALDAETEHAITQSIAELHGDLTIVLIAHRLSTVKNCDRIFFLEEGRIVAVDTFDRLMRSNGQFQRMVRRLEFRVGEDEGAAVAVPSGPP
jgi:ATP-binding cassette, subfamily B, bacterial PglK